MKTSFYFILWIAIYPLLGLLHNDFINHNAFFVALFVVFGLSYVLNRLMPKTLAYERVSEIAPIMEDIYTRRVDAFTKRVSREAVIETVTAVYFFVTATVILLTMISTGVYEWLELAIFGLFAFGAISRSGKLLRARAELKDDPTPEQCVEVAQTLYRLDYASYSQMRQNTTYEGMLPPRPRYFKLFQIFSIIVAVGAILLGIGLLVWGGITAALTGLSTNGIVYALMLMLYGALAAGFGIKDTISIAQNLKQHKPCR